MSSIIEDLERSIRQAVRMGQLEDALNHLQTLAGHVPLKLEISDEITLCHSCLALLSRDRSRGMLTSDQFLVGQSKISSRILELMADSVASAFQTSQAADPIFEAVLQLLSSGSPFSLSRAGVGGNVVVLLASMVANPPVMITSADLRRWRRNANHSFRHYLTSLILDEAESISEYIPLSGHANIVDGSDYPGRSIPIEFRALRVSGVGFDRRIVREPLADLQKALSSYPQFVVLGPPGSGKSTILRRLARNHAQDLLSGARRIFPVTVHLGSISRSENIDSAFAQAKRIVKIFRQSFEVPLIERVLLLVDGLNEVSQDDIIPAVNAIKSFVDQHPECLAVVSCRTLDYTAHLDFQQIEIAPLEDKQIRAYLTAMAPTHSASWEKWLASHALSPILRTPMMLSALVWLGCPNIATEPATRIVRELIEFLFRREMVNWTDAGEEEVEAWRVFLRRLGWRMQAVRRTRLKADEFISLIAEIASSSEWLSRVSRERFLRFARNASIIVHQGDYRSFEHHLYQEHLAGQEIVRLFERIGSGSNDPSLAELWRSPEQNGECALGVYSRDWLPLPPPPQTGWEEAVVAASALVQELDAFIRCVASTNPVLSARCILECGRMVTYEARSEVAHKLLNAMTDNANPIQVRVVAGEAVGRLGDPRFSSGTPESPLIGEFVLVKQGKHLIGEEERDPQEPMDSTPIHEVPLGEFSIGRYPVTVAEYERFVDSGGYNDLRWWSDPISFRWLSGLELEDGAANELMRHRNRLIESRKPLEQWAEYYGWRPDTLSFWKRLVSLTEADGIEMLRVERSIHGRRSPAFWDDERYHTANLPVVGVTWLEVCAYCRWLSARFNQTYRLPTEYEWEAAAAGVDLSAEGSVGNTVENRLLKPSPVGAFPRDNSLWGMQDVCGNVREWTISADLRYPYDPALQSSEPLGRKVVRGGAWTRSVRVSRRAFRDHFAVDFFDSNLGFRLVTTP